MTDTPHDALFKGAFERPGHAANLFRHALPAKVVAAIQWANLHRKSGSFIDPELADRHSDLLLPLRSLVGTRSCICFLEHQSSNDPDMPLRSLIYVFRILERYRKQHPREALPIVLPLVVSHAPGGWTSPRSLHAMFEPYPASIPELAPLVLDLSLLVEDLAHLGDDKLHARAMDAFPRLALWVLRDPRDPARFIDALGRWAAALEATARAESRMQAVAQVLHYVTLVTEDLHIDAFRAKLRRLAPRPSRRP